MPSKIALLLFTALLAVPLTAHADTMDSFTLTGPNLIATWSASSTVTTPDYSLFDSVEQGVSITINGVPNYSVAATYYTFIYPELSISFYGLTNGPGTLSGPDVYNWTTIPASNPFPYLPYDVVATFRPGTYNLTDPSTQTAYTLSIAAQSAAAPEPASIALLATGVLSALAAVRLNRRADMGLAEAS